MLPRMQILCIPFVSELFARQIRLCYRGFPGGFKEIASAVVNEPVPIKSFITVL